MNGVKEFEFSDKDFNFLREFVKEQTGINLSDSKRELVYGRLAKRLRILKLGGFSEYCERLRGGDDTETVSLVDSITTNLTSFFRENHHFEYLADQLIPRIQKENHISRRARIWSAGCSSGEEPYSIAMVLKESMPSTGGWDTKVLATDLDSNIVARAKSGVYDLARINSLPRNRLKRWFNKGKGDNAGQIQVVPALQEMITFKQLNLMHEWPIKGPFDAIFCRNVVIYFDKPTQRVLFDRYADLLKDNGILFIGHSESLFKVSDRFKLLGKTIYQKCS